MRRGLKAKEAGSSRPQRSTDRRRSKFQHVARHCNCNRALRKHAPCRQQAVFSRGSRCSLFLRTRSCHGTGVASLPSPCLWTPWCRWQTPSGACGALENAVHRSEGEQPRAGSGRSEGSSARVLLGQPQVPGKP